MPAGPIRITFVQYYYVLYINKMLYKIVWYNIIVERFGVQLYTIGYHSDSHVHFDLWVRGVAIDTKVFKLKIINVLDLVTSDDLKSAWGRGVALE